MLSELYIGLFATVMLGAILVNVLLGLGDLTDVGCTTGGCLGARTVGPAFRQSAAVYRSRFLRPTSEPQGQRGWRSQHSKPLAQGCC